MYKYDDVVTLRAMATVFLGVLLILAAGVAYRFIPGLPSALEVRRVIGAIVLNIFLPALTLSILSTAPLSNELWAVPLVSVACIVVAAGAAWLIYMRVLGRRLARPTIGALLLASVWCNATYLGVPIVTAVVGEPYARIPIVFDLLAMSPMLFTLGVVICVEFGTATTKHTIGEGLRHVLRLPPFLAAVVGLLLNVLHVPIWEPFLVAMQTMGKAVSPLMIFSVGLALRPPQWRTVPVLIPALVIKLAVAPIVAAGMITVLGSAFTTSTATATMLEAGMPTMMLTMVFAERYQLDTETLAQAILVSTLLAMLTLPFLASTPIL